MLPSALCPLTKHLGSTPVAITATSGSRALPHPHPTSTRTGPAARTSRGQSQPPSTTTATARTTPAVGADSVVRAAGTYYLWERLYSTHVVSFTVDRVADLFGSAAAAPPRGKKLDEEDEEGRESDVAVRGPVAAAPVERTPSTRPSEAETIADMTPPPLPLLRGGLGLPLPQLSHAHQSSTAHAVEKPVRASLKRSREEQRATPPTPLPSLRAFYVEEPWRAQTDSVTAKGPSPPPPGIGLGGGDGRPVAMKDKDVDGKEDAVDMNHACEAEEQRRYDEADANEEARGGSGLAPPQADSFVQEPETVRVLSLDVTALPEDDNDNGSGARRHHANSSSSTQHMSITLDAGSMGQDGSGLPDLIQDSFSDLSARLATTAVTNTTAPFAASSGTTGDSSILWGEAQQDQHTILDDDSNDAPSPPDHRSERGDDCAALHLPPATAVVGAPSPKWKRGSKRPRSESDGEEDQDHGTESAQMPCNDADKDAGEREMLLAGDEALPPSEAPDALDGGIRQDTDEEADRLVSLANSPDYIPRCHRRGSERQCRHLRMATAGGGDSTVASPSSLPRYRSSPPSPTPLPRRQEQDGRNRQSTEKARCERSDGLCLTPSPSTRHTLTAAAEERALPPAHATTDRNVTVDGLVLTPPPTALRPANEEEEADMHDDDDEHSQVKGKWEEVEHGAQRVEKGEDEDSKELAESIVLDEAVGGREDVGVELAERSEAPRHACGCASTDEGRGEEGFPSLLSAAAAAAAVPTTLHDSACFLAPSGASPAPRTPSALPDGGPYMSEAPEHEDEGREPRGVLPDDDTNHEQSTAVLADPFTIAPSTVITPLQADLDAADDDGHGSGGGGGDGGGGKGKSVFGSPLLTVPQRGETREEEGEEGGEAEGTGDFDDFVSATTANAQSPSRTPSPHHLSPGGGNEEEEEAADAEPTSSHERRQRRAALSRSLDGKSFLWAEEADAVLSQQRQRLLLSQPRTTAASAAAVSPTPRDDSKGLQSQPSMFSLPRGVSLPLPPPPPHPQRRSPQTHSLATHDIAPTTTVTTTTGEESGDEKCGAVVARARSRVAPSVSPPPTAPTLSTTARSRTHHSLSAAPTRRGRSQRRGAAPPSDTTVEEEEGSATGSPRVYSASAVNTSFNTAAKGVGGGGGGKPRAKAGRPPPQGKERPTTLTAAAARRAGRGGGVAATKQTHHHHAPARRGGGGRGRGGGSSNEFGFPTTLLSAMSGGGEGGLVKKKKNMPRKR